MGSRGAHLRSVSVQWARPAAGDQPLTFRGAREPADQHGGSGEVRPQQEHLAHVRVRRPWLCMQVVAVVPADNEAEVRHWGELSRSRADDGMYLTAHDGKPALVAFLRAEVGRENQVSAVSEFLQHRRIQSCDVTGVRDDSYHTAA
jgi:hypothetical protein